MSPTLTSMGMRRMIWSCSGIQLSEPDALRLVLQLLQARGGAGIIRREQLRDRRRHGRSRPWSRAARSPCGEAMKPSTTGRLADRLGEDLVVAGELLDLLLKRRESIRFRPEAQRVGRRHAVGLGEHHVEADRRGAAGGKLVDELGQHGARPGPLADPLQATPRRYRRCAPARPGSKARGLEPLIGVEDQRPQPRDRRWVPDAKRKRSRDDRPDDEDIEETRTHPGA